MEQEELVFKELKGRKLMLCDVIYQRGNASTKWSDYISFVYKDLYTKEKGLYTIKDPTIMLYEVPEELRTFKKARHYMEKEKLIPHKVLYREVLKEIANIAGGNWKKWHKERKSFNDKRQLYKYPYCLGGDIPIETYYRVIWDKELGNDLPKELSCIYLDIEINQMKWSGPIPRGGECPIDMVSVCDELGKTVYTFYLKMKDNPTIPKFIEEEQEILQKELHERFDEAFPDYKYLQFAFEEDDEAEMLSQLFRLINSLKRDICFVWNMDFDIPYIIGRASRLKINPVNLFCHSDFPVPTFFYREDGNNFDWDKKRNYFECTSYTHYLDQPVVYASLRRSQTTLRKVNLDAIAKRERVGDGKIKFNKTGGNFVTFSYNDFKLYDIYNVNDVLLQSGINQRCNDAFNLYNSCYNSFCNYKDGLKQTVSLRSFFYFEFLLNDNSILGHNVNFDNGKKEGDPDSYDDDADLEHAIETFEGAINGDPKLNGHNGLVLFGKKSKYLYGACADFDFSAMYPNSICSFNIFATTMIGKLFITDGDKLSNYDIDPGKEFVEDMISKQIIHMGTKWFGLPNYETITDELETRLKLL